MLNDKKVQYSDYLSGWNLGRDEDNDCGTIYANILYGVKAYFRRPTDEGYEFIKKQDFFLYTLPLYNQYYYTVNDFTQLANPQLELALTYKLQDFGTKTPYTKEGVVYNGYPYADQEVINTYLGGFYNTQQNTSFSTVKYYLNLIFASYIYIFCILSNQKLFKKND